MRYWILLFRNPAFFCSLHLSHRNNEVVCEVFLITFHSRKVTREFSFHGFYITSENARVWWSFNVDVYNVHCSSIRTAFSRCAFRLCFRQQFRRVIKFVSFVLMRNVVNGVTLFSPCQGWAGKLEEFSDFVTKFNAEEEWCVGLHIHYTDMRICTYFNL